MSEKAVGRATTQSPTPQSPPYTQVKEEEDGAGNDLTFTTTSEFCRALQGAKAHVPAVVKEEKLKAAQNHSTGVTELVKRAGEVIFLAWFEGVVFVRGGGLLGLSGRGVLERAPSPNCLFVGSASV